MPIIPWAGLVEPSDGPACAEEVARRLESKRSGSLVPVHGIGSEWGHGAWKRSVLSTRCLLSWILIIDH